MEQDLQEEFGRLLKYYRKNGTDPVNGERLTQEKLAELLETLADVPGYTFVRVSNWERGKEVISQDNRKLLVGLIRILHLCGGLKTLTQADDLLFAGGYRNLDLGEISVIDNAWNQGIKGIVPEDLVAFTERPSETGSITTLPAGKGQVQMYSPLCGDEGIDLGNQRLLVSTSFGAYLTGLLERGHNYLNLDNQINCPAPAGQEPLSVIERIFWALHYPKGPRILIIAADGGMGKSTLAAKITRCLFQEEVTDMILGDSAKRKLVDVISGQINSLEPGYYDPTSCYLRLCDQLGIPAISGQEKTRKILTKIGDRLIDRRALILVDNLETVEAKGDLVQGLKRLANKNIRVIITTRQVDGIGIGSPDVLIVHLNPLLQAENVRTFLKWHINHFHNEYPALKSLEGDLENTRRIQSLIAATGGIPLLLQLVASDIVRYSWDYLGQLPKIFGKELLNFLYLSRWEELGSSGETGSLGRMLLHWISTEQYRGRKVTFARLVDWTQESGNRELLPAALQLLYERFLTVNQDPEFGNFVIFPSLSEFLRQI